MKEIPITLLARTLTIKRLLNAGMAVASYLVSTISKKTIVWGRPLILTVEPTNICNLKCPLCVTGNGRMTRKAGLMSLETFKRTVDEVSDRLFYLLLYHQGEPFINKAFLDFVEYAKRKRIFVTTSTNAHYFNEETARHTVMSGLDSIIISVDGPDQKSYETYRVGGDLANVRSGIANLVRQKKKLRSKTPVIYLQFIVMRHNEHQISEMQALAKDLGVDKFLTKTVQVENAEEAREWLPKADSLRRYGVDDDKLEPKRLVRMPCHRPWTSSLVNWDGSVVPCCFDKNGAHKFGTVTEANSFAKTWESDEYDTFRSKMLRNRDALDICSNCSQGLRLFI